MSFVREVFVWFNDPLNWRGTSGVFNRLLEHGVLSLLSLLAACLIAIPGGVLLGRSTRKGSVAINVANIGRAIPSFAVIVLGVIWLGIGYRPVFLALVLLAIPPVFTLTFTAIRQVDTATVDAARGMGMPERRVLRRVQLPMALPLILDGVRLSSAAIIATATLAALVGAGGLGRFIIDGFAVRDFAEVTAGVILVIVLVLFSEATFSVLGRLLVSPGLRLDRRRSGRSRRIGRRPVSDVSLS